jgi:NCAIR mutase (PurE)-related protein
VIAVPTSIGYGASFGGLAALLGMLNSCAAGVSVVNIDNGFGAGYQAALINRLAGPERTAAGALPPAILRAGA